MTRFDSKNVVLDLAVVLEKPIIVFVSSNFGPKFK